MSDVEREVDRYLTLLRNTSRASGFTQLEVQEALGWGRSYFSQLLTKQKTLRIEQILMIINVINVINIINIYISLLGVRLYFLCP